MYFSCSENVIWNHHNKVAVAVAKDFVFVKDLKKTIADVIVVKGLCGSCNTIERKNNRLLRVKSSNKLIDEIGTIGYVNKKGVFEFHDGSVTINVPSSMCEFYDKKLNYCILKQKSTRRSKKKSSYIQEKDYDVYKLLRYYNDWYWNRGVNTCGSDKKRISIEKTKLKNFHKLAKASIKLNK